jgi:hypothetical protein
MKGTKKQIIFAEIKHKYNIINVFAKNINLNKALFEKLLIDIRRLNCRPLVIDK